MKTQTTMNIKSIRNIFVLALILTIAFGCSKYEDGPWISFRSIKKRILGVYRIEYFAKNDSDLTSYYNQYYDIQYDFHESVNDRPLKDEFYIELSGSIDSCGTWKGYRANSVHLIRIINGDVLVYFSFDIDTTYYPNRYIYPLFIEPIVPYPQFIITRLTNTEIWVKHTDGNDVYEIHFQE